MQVWSLSLSRRLSGPDRECPPNRTRQSNSASKWNVSTLTVEDWGCGCSTSICHLVKDPAHNGGAFRRSRWDGLKGHAIEMILVPERMTEVVVPFGIVGVAYEMNARPQ